MLYYARRHGLSFKQRKFHQGKEVSAHMSLWALNKGHHMKNEFITPTSINTIRVVEGNKPFSENDKLSSNVQVCWQRILAANSEYVRKSESEIRCNRVMSVLHAKASRTTKQKQDAPKEFQI